MRRRAYVVVRKLTRTVVQRRECPRDVLCTPGNSLGEQMQGTRKGSRGSVRVGTQLDEPLSCDAADADQLFSGGEGGIRTLEGGLTPLLA